MTASMRVIVNPASRSGTTGRDWSAIEAKLRSALGELDVVCVRGQSVASLLRKFPCLYRGTHITDPTVSVHRSKRVDAEAEPGRLWLDIDGEPLGTLPATIELLPDALELFGVPAQPAP